jgi:UDP-glucose 4-epimerase
MNVLVIGGAGYIGGHVVRELLDSGHETTVFDNFSSGHRRRLFPEADFLYGDIQDFPTLLVAMRRGFDAVVHLAALKAAGESMTAPEKYSWNNLNGTVNVLNAMCAARIEILAFSSSAAVYGEPRYLPIDENHPTNPENFYGFTKLEIERILGWYERLKGIRFAALRYFNAAGYDVEGRVGGIERNPANLIPIVMETACGMRKSVQIFGGDYETDDGTCVRDYVHVSDLAAAHAAALEFLAAGGKSLTVNLGSETGTSVLELVRTACRISGKAIPAAIGPRRAGDPAKLTASAGLAEKLLGWKARHSDMETLLRSAWEVYRREAAR